MAISEITKQIVHGQVISGMKARWLKLKADREALEAQYLAMGAQMDTLKAQYEVLIVDIPKPTPTPPQSEI